MGSELARLASATARKVRGLKMWRARPRRSKPVPTRLTGRSNYYTDRIGMQLRCPLSVGFSPRETALPILLVVAGRLPRANRSPNHVEWHAGARSVNHGSKKPRIGPDYLGKLARCRIHSALAEEASPLRELRAQRGELWRQCKRQ